MGYTTEFRGTLSLSRELTKEESEYINRFSGTRRMKRDTDKLHEMFKGEHGAPGLIDTYGYQGEYFAKDDGYFGQAADASVIDSNEPAENQPGLWCHWVINEENELEWDGGEKFYEYDAWLAYLITHFFKPWGVVLNGKIEWRGEEWDDTGVIKVVDNDMTVTYK